MNNDIEHPNNPRNSKAIAGIVLLAIGAILLLHQFDDFLSRIGFLAGPCGLFSGA